MGEHEPSAKSRKVNNTSTIAFMLMITTSIFNNMLMLNLGRQGTTRNEEILSYSTKADTVATHGNDKEQHIKKTCPLPKVRK